MMSNLPVKVGLQGCDDSVYVDFIMSREEYSFLLKIARDLLEAKTEHCQPTLLVTDDPTWRP